MYFHFVTTAHVFVLVCGALAVSLAVLQAVRFGAAAGAQLLLALTQLVISMCCVRACLRARPERAFEALDAGHATQGGLRTAPEVRALDPPAARSRTRLLVLLAAEAVLFLAYNLALLIRRAGPALTLAPPEPAQFLLGLIPAYISAIHRGVLVGFGLHGARAQSRSALRFYLFGNTLFALLDAVGALHSGWQLHAGQGEALPLVCSAALLSLFTLVQACGAGEAWRLAQYLGQSWHGNAGEAARSNFISPARLAGSAVSRWLAAVLGLLQVEALVAIVAQAVGGVQASTYCTGLNFSFHAVFIFLMSFAKMAAPRQHSRKVLLGLRHTHTTHTQYTCFFPPLVSSLGP